MIYKAEVVRLAGSTPRDNPRFVVTNLPHKPENVYKIYRLHGDSENRIKELDNKLYLGRTSCHRPLANQFRVLLTAAAYVLMQMMRTRMLRTLRSIARKQIDSLRLMLFKIAGRVERSVRRVVIHLSEQHA